MHSYLGIDTSNYTTSVTKYNQGKVLQYKQLLNVKKGTLGLRQSEAVFQHIKQIPELILNLDNLDNIAAIGVSSRPRDLKDSYMPCFTVGTSVAKIISKILNVPVFNFSHQAGHIVAVLYSTKKLEFLDKNFLAFHISGGTSEAILVEPDENKIIKCSIVSKTLDLNAGQAVDRVGNMLGLTFPAGKQLENLALEYKGSVKPNVCTKGHDFCLSGLENICLKMKNGNESYSKIARYCIEHIGQTLDDVLKELTKLYKDMPIIFSGGVMSNSIIKNMLSNKYNAFFAEPEFSSDNAVGVAVLASIMWERNNDR